MKYSRCSGKKKCLSLLTGSLMAQAATVSLLTKDKYCTLHVTLYGLDFNVSQRTCVWRTTSVKVEMWNGTLGRPVGNVCYDTVYTFCQQQKGTSGKTIMAIDFTWLLFVCHASRLVCLHVLGHTKWSAKLHHITTTSSVLKCSISSLILLLTVSNLARKVIGSFVISTLSNFWHTFTSLTICSIKLPFTCSSL